MLENLLGIATNSKNIEVQLNKFMESNINIAGRDEAGHNILHHILIRMALTEQSEEAKADLLNFANIFLSICSKDPALLIQLQLPENARVNALFKAVEFENKDFVELLLKYGFDPNVYDGAPNPNSALDEAIRSANSKIIKLFLEEPRTRISDQQAYKIFKLITPDNGLRNPLQNRGKTYEITNFRNKLFEDAAEGEIELLRANGVYLDAIHFFEANKENMELENQFNKIKIALTKAEHKRDFFTKRIMEEGLKNYDFNTFKTYFDKVREIMSVPPTLDNKYDLSKYFYHNKASDQNAFSSFYLFPRRNTLLMANIGKFIHENQPKSKKLWNLLRTYDKDEDDVTEIEQLIQSDTWLNYSCDYASMLNMCIKGDFDEEELISLVELLLNQGADPSITLPCTALASAIAEEKIDIIKLLIARGIDIDNWGNQQSLDDIFEEDLYSGKGEKTNYEDLVKLLIESGINQKHLDTIIFAVVEYCDVEMVKYLLKNNKISINSAFSLPANYLDIVQAPADSNLPKYNLLVINMHEYESEYKIFSNTNSTWLEKVQSDRVIISSMLLEAGIEINDLVLEYRAKLQETDPMKILLDKHIASRTLQPEKKRKYDKIENNNIAKKNVEESDEVSALKLKLEEKDALIEQKDTIIAELRKRIKGLEDEKSVSKPKAQNWQHKIISSEKNSKPLPERL